MNWLKGAVGVGTQIGSSALQKEEKARVPNFPQCCPVVYHSISEIPGFKKVLCILGVVQYVVFVVLLWANFLGAILALTCGFAASWNNGMDYLSMLLISGFMAIFASFFALFLQYWPVYMACSSKMSLKYWFFFVTEFVAIIFFLIQFAGIYFIGGCGILSGLSMWFRFVAPTGYNYVVLAFHMIVGVSWFGLALLGVFILAAMFKYYKEDNATLHDATSAISGFLFKKSLGIGG